MIFLSYAVINNVHKKIVKQYVTLGDSKNHRILKSYVVGTDGKHKQIYGSRKEEAVFSKLDNTTYGYISSGWDGINGNVYFLNRNICYKYNASTQSYTQIVLSNTPCENTYLVAAKSWNIDTNQRLVQFIYNTGSDNYTGFNVFDVSTESFVHTDGAMVSSTYTQYGNGCYHSDGYCYFICGDYLRKYDPSSNIISLVGGIGNRELGLFSYNGNLIGLSVDRTNNVVLLYYVNTTSGAMTQYASIDYSSSSSASEVIVLPQSRSLQVDDSILIPCTYGLLAIDLSDSTFYDIACSDVPAMNINHYAPIYCETSETLMWLSETGGYYIYKFQF